ncbi:MAG: HAD-IC family P-type ATPase [Anaerolineae bacterium]|nr:HAD-IC family P-type ATPase [Anaerolineae bacterium]
MDADEPVPWHQLGVEDVYIRLQTGDEGLSAEEAERRLQTFGPNRLAAERGIRPLQILLEQLQSPLIYILIAASAVTVFLGDLVDTAVILAVVVLNTVLGFIQEYKAEQALQALTRLAAPQARVVREGREQEIAAAELVPGDLVLLEAGARVPADLRLIRAFELQVDESALTGESVPVPKDGRPIPEADVPLADRRNMAYLGTVVVRGRGAALAVATGMQTAFGRISAQVRGVERVRTPLQARLDQFARMVAIGVLGVTALVFVLGLTTSEALVDILLTAVATAVATVPEGLPVTITVALAVGVSRMARRMAIIRKLAAVETLGSCTVVCSDKTGTLTRNEMTVTRIDAGGQEYQVTGAGYAPAGEVTFEGRPVSVDEAPALELTLRTGLLANESSVIEEEGEYRVRGDPTEAALIVAARKAGLLPEHEREAYPLLDEIPFESERRYMATLHEHEGRRLVFVKGAPERIVAMSETAVMAAAPQLEPAGRRPAAAGAATAPLDRQAIVERSSAFAAEGLRVLAMAWKEVPPGTAELDHREVESGLTLAGLQAMIDPPRPEAIEAVASAQAAGIRAVMITGDHRVTGEAIARQMGIVREPGDQVVEGSELEAMDDAALYARVRQIAVFARAAPEHKLRVVQQLRAHGEVVAVTGDGVNDAPALKQADIGVAMGVTGTDVAKEAADMVLADDNFATIYAAVEEGRVVFDNIRKVIIFLIPTGVGLVLTILASIALRLPLPFLPAQVIWINLVTNGLQDVAMAFEPPEEDVGRRPPRDPEEGVLTPLMVWRTVLVGLILLVGTLGVFTWQLRGDPDLTRARTMALTTMVLFQNFHVFNSRSFTRSALRMDPFSNRVLFASIVGALGLQVLAIYWGPLQFVLRTEPLTLQEWLTVIPVAASALVAVEIEKAIRRWRG